jgi:hypothetical protein
MSDGMPLTPSYTPGVAILDKEKRIFSGWGTVEVRDDEGEILPVEYIEKVLKVMEERGPGGALIGVAHGRKGIQTPGKTLAQIVTKYKLEDGREVPAVWIVGQIHKHYKSDDEVWEKIVSGEYAMFSLGGMGQRYQVPCDGLDCPTINKVSEGWEWTLTPKGMNPLSAIVKQFENIPVIGFDYQEATIVAKEAIESITTMEESVMEKEEKEEFMKELAALIEKGLEPVTKEIEELKTGLDEVKKAQEAEPEPEPEKVEKEEEPTEPVEKMEEEDDKDKKDKKKKSVYKEDLEQLRKDVNEDIKTLLEEQFKKEVEAELDDPEAGTETDSPGGQTGAITKEALETGQTQEGEASSVKEPWDADKDFQY